MARYTITHICGHTENHQIIGPEADRPRKADWLREQPCAACREAETNAKREGERAAAAEATKDLPPLTGSEKQIAWATTIRAAAKAAIDARLAAMTRPMSDADRARMDKFYGQPASYWIDNRHRGDDANAWLRAIIEMGK